MIGNKPSCQPLIRKPNNGSDFTQKVRQRYIMPNHNDSVVILQKIAQKRKISQYITHSSIQPDA